MRVSKVLEDWCCKFIEFMIIILTAGITEEQEQRCIPPDAIYVI
jgi:hypothetical protein